MRQTSCCALCSRAATYWIHCCRHSSNFSVRRGVYFLLDPLNTGSECSPRHSRLLSPLPAISIRLKSTSKRPKRKTQDAASNTGKWDAKLRELQDFVEEHGHARVPQAHPRLGGWVNANRKEYKKYRASRIPLMHQQQSGSSTSAVPPSLTQPPCWMTLERVASLEALGFEWDVDEAMWLEYYEKMVVYRKEHGNCLVPRSHPTLATWVRMNRHEYQKMKQGEMACSMTPTRAQLLDKIDFCWNAREAAWQEKYGELKDFCSVNGYGVTPPKATHSGLCDWLGYQKKLYRKKSRGEQVTLTDKRIHDLEQLGFVFSSQKDALRRKEK